MRQRSFFMVTLILATIVLGTAVPSALAAPQQQAIVVTSTADSGPGTLREALERASLGTTITFDPTVFPPDDPATISLISALPELSEGQLIIDASDAGVILDGSQFSREEVIHGLIITSNGNVIRGLQILRFHGNGITIQGGAQNNTIGGDWTLGAGPTGQGNVISGNDFQGVHIAGAGTDHNLVIGNLIGVDVDGKEPLPNFFGVLIDDGGSHNTVQGNVVSGNHDGVTISGSGTMSNTVSGNYIGTNAVGDTAIGNEVDGVWIGVGAQYNVVGGATPEERNIISGNGNNGTVIDASAYNTIGGNYIGTDATGAAALGNANIGVVLAWGAQYNLIGGTPGERNIISGNGNVGVSIANRDTMSNTVSSNYIGTDVTGTAAISNTGVGVWIGDGAQYNVIGGATPQERNLISASARTGLNMQDSDTMWNVVTGNYIGTDFSGTMAMGNLVHGVHIHNGAGPNTIGPGNIIAYNGENGVSVLGADTLGNTITANSIYGNGGLGIQNGEGGNTQLPPPTIIYVSTRTIRGTAPPNSRVEIFFDEEDQGRIFQGSIIADAEGNFVYSVPVATSAGPNVTTTAVDGEGNTSQFSPPESPRAPIATRELPGIVGPTQVSVEPRVIGTNLGLALFCVLFFGITSNIFNSILKDYRDELAGAFSRLVPRPLADAISKADSSVASMAAKRRGKLLLMWLIVLLVTALVESFLDPEVGVLSTERLGLLMTLFVSAVAVSALELGSDLYAHRRWAATTRAESNVQWVGIAIALACVILSRALDFKPGYLYGIVGAIYLMPKLAGIPNSGKRAVFVLVTILAGGLILWVATVFLPAVLAELEPIFLTIFLISLQGVFFALLPLAFTDGGDIWSWRKGVWLVFFAVVLFCFYHFLLNPTASDVKALQQNGVQTLLVLVVIFGLATLVLWLVLPFRLARKGLNKK